MGTWERYEASFTVVCCTSVSFKVARMQDEHDGRSRSRVACKCRILCVIVLDELKEDVFIVS